jgi:general secretion pathway protein D
MISTSSFGNARLLRSVAAAALLGIVALPAHAQPQQQAGQQAAPAAASNGNGQQITLNLKDADLTALINTVAEVTGRNFIVDPRVKARVTVISREPMPAEELYRVFLSVLQVHGFSAVESGDVVKIVPEINAKQLAVPTVDRRADAADDEIVTRVIPVKNVSAAQLVPILRPLVPQQGHLAAYPPTNVLIVSDRAANVERLSDIIARIDRAGDEEIEVVPLEYASAPELVRIVSALRQQTGPEQAPSSGVRLAADDRTNSILLSGDKAERLRVRALIAHLDTPVESGGETQVVYLRYAKAKDLVPVLTGVSENLQKAEAQAQPGAGGGGGAPAPAARSGGGGRQDVMIEAHEATNSVVITAPPKLQRSLLTVIRQLDIRRAQVLVEAAVAEISESKGRSLGVEAVGLDSTGDAPAVSSLFGSISGGLQSLLGVSQGGELFFNPSGLGSGITVAVGDLGGRYMFGFLIRALASSSNANILSTPSLVTLDNQEAEIRVARNVPFVTGQFTNQGQNATNPFQTITREDVGLILKIKPQINEGNSVLLDISQEVSSLEEERISGQPITNKRSVTTTVLVEDGQLVALGGLIDERVIQSEQKVPLLGDVPLLGNLFKARNSSKEKRNLILFLQPSILRDDQTASAFASRKYNYMRARQLEQNAQGISLMPGEDVPVLPELQRPAIPAPFGTTESREQR